MTLMLRDCRTVQENDTTTVYYKVGNVNNGQG